MPLLVVLLTFLASAITDEFMSGVWRVMEWNVVISNCRMIMTNKWDLHLNVGPGVPHIHKILPSGRESYTENSYWT